jgi:hypothetical protein
MMVNREKKRSLIELTFKKKLKELRNLKRLSAMCVAITKYKIQTKLNDKGTICVLVGYAVNHADDVYRVLNPTTKIIIKSRDVLRLNNKYETWIKSKKEDTSVSNDSDGQVEILKDKHEIEKSSSEVPVDGKNVRIEMALKETSKLKS